jgi:hypothetical protein
MSDTDTRAGLDLAALERTHYRLTTGQECRGCDQRWPCDAALLLAEVRRLRAVADAAREAIAVYTTAIRESTVVEAMQRLADALNPPAPPHVTGEAAQRAVDAT